MGIAVIALGLATLLLIAKTTDLANRLYLSCGYVIAIAGMCYLIISNWSTKGKKALYLGLIAFSLVAVLGLVFYANLVKQQRSDVTNIGKDK